VKNFQELIETAKGNAPKKCVVVAAEDKTVLEGVKMAQVLGLIRPVLVGNKDSITRIARELSLDTHTCEIHHEAQEDKALQKAISLVKAHGDILMKGMLSSSSFLKGVLDKKLGLRTGNILSHIAALEIPGYHKLLFMSDGGMNPELNLQARIKIIDNAVTTLHALGIQNPKIGLIAASETPHPDMPETIDAVSIVKLNRDNTIKNCIIEGPFGFDVAVSKRAAEIKKISSMVAGDVDFLLMPNISAANIWAKGLIYFAGAKAAGMVVGAQRPIIMLSRADDPATKLNSIALGVTISTQNKN